jgi:ABC-type dipeptide/oligopeptide/nickel transport system permease component
MHNDVTLKSATDEWTALMVGFGLATPSFVVACDRLLFSLRINIFRVKQNSTVKWYNGAGGGILTNCHRHSMNEMI